MSQCLLLSEINIGLFSLPHLLLSYNWGDTVFGGMELFIRTGPLVTGTLISHLVLLLLAPAGLCLIACGLGPSLWSTMTRGGPKFFESLLTSVQFSRSVMSDSLQPHELQHTRPPCSSPTPGVHKLTSIESVMPSSHLILCRPLLLLPPIPPSIRVFSNESALHIRWPKYWSFSLSISPFNEHPGLISFRMDWLNLLAVCHASVCSSILCLVTTKIWSDGL